MVGKGHVGPSLGFLDRLQSFVARKKKKKGESIPPPEDVLAFCLRRGLDPDFYAVQLCTYKSEDAMGQSWFY